MVITEPILNNLILSLHPSLVSTIKGIVKREDVSEDIAMLAWQMIWERQNDFGTIEQVRAFLFIAAKNMALTQMKGQKIRADLERKNVEFNETTVHQVLAIENNLFINDAVKALIKRFHYKYVSVFMKTIEGKTSSQIGLELNIPASTVTTIRSRIIAYLRKIFNS